MFGRGILRRAMSLFRGIGFFIIAATEVYAIMKDTESNEAKGGREKSAL